MSEAGQDVSIRKATPADVALLSSLSIVTIYEAYFEQDDPHDLSKYLNENFTTEAIATEIASPACAYFVAFRRGKAVGYAKLRNGEPHESVTNKNAIELQRIYLIERVWGTGIGELLLDRCVIEARSMGREVLWLGVWEENLRGLSFYAKHGFERVGTLTFPYADSVGINAVMQISL
jgi:ribosomal protein S18 acetylase RimI-like enzyme